MEVILPEVLKLLKKILTIFFFFWHCKSISYGVGEVSTHPFCMYNKNILITLSKWRLNEVQFKCTRVDEGMQKTKEWGFMGRWNNQMAILGFLWLRLFELHLWFTHTIYPRNSLSLILHASRAT